MSLIWDNWCHQCCRPVDVYFDYNEYDVDLGLSAVRFMDISKFSLDYNVSFYKRYGNKWKIVCTHCFNNKPRYNPRVDALRQIGVKVKIGPKSYTKTADQIHMWNRLFKQYLKNSI